MVQSPLFLILLFLASWIAVFALFRRLWSRTKAGQEWRAFNSRVNPAVRRRAASIRFLLLIVLGVTILLAAEQFRRLFHTGEAPGDASGLAVALIVVSSYMIAIFPAQMLTNLIWRLTPSMRKASDAAKEGLGAVSFGYADRLLALQAVVVVPLCLAQIWLGATMK